MLNTLIQIPSDIDDQQSDTIEMPRHDVDSDRGNTLYLKYLIPSPTSLFLVIFFIISLLMNGGFNPLTRRGFFCNDTTIRYPVRTDTVSFRLLLIIALVIPSIVIAFLERTLAKLLASSCYKSGPRSRKDSNNFENDKELAEELMPVETNDPDNVSFKGSGSEATNSFGEITDLKLFLFGFIATAFLTGIGKTTSGRLRPHFMARCKPDVDCTSPANMYRYIDDFKCSDETMRLRDYNYITTSWPSGHASIIFFSMFYLIFYLDSIIFLIVGVMAMSKSSVVRYNPLILHCIYVLMVGLAIYISLTRVSDYHHHPLDVLTGAILGLIIAIVMSKYVLSPRFASLPMRKQIKR